ncbi:MAG: SDR family oxidoreductase [Saprospiraceae bacterium]|nr:SDR family oxidoreductase [Saprospiraceae bacterium]
MRILVTGATGYIGQALCHQLMQTDHRIHVLCRSKEKAKSLTHPNVQIFFGQIQDPVSVSEAMRDCESVFHLAAHAKMWDIDVSNFYKVNVQATDTLMQIALQMNVRRVVYTSTGGTMEPYKIQSGPVTENQPRYQEPDTDYVKSKLIAERRVLSFSNKGLEVVVVNPTRVFGPGKFSDSNAVTRMIKQFCEGKWKFLPGSGKSQANYVYVDDVVKGHLLALNKGLSGERYILGGTNISYLELFQLLKELSGASQHLWKIPVPLIVYYAYLQLLGARFLGIEPSIIPAFAKKLTKHWPMSSDKAISKLGYTITPLREGLMKTLQWLEHGRGR